MRYGKGWVFPESVPRHISVSFYRFARYPNRNVAASNHIRTAPCPSPGQISFKSGFELVRADLSISRSQEPTASIQDPLLNPEP